MKKRALSLILATAMVAGILTGCGSSGSGDSTSASAGTGAESSSSSADDGEITKLVVWGYGTADTEDCNEVAEAISKITREKIGAEVELVRGKDTDQLNLALTTGEAIDLLNYAGGYRSSRSGCLPLRRSAVCAAGSEGYFPFRRLLNAKGHCRCTWY